VLDPPLIQQHPIEDLGTAEVVDDHPAGDQIVRTGLRTGGAPLGHLRAPHLAVAGGRLLEIQRFIGLILEPCGPS
jgi:hypothetical protein